MWRVVEEVGPWPLPPTSGRPPMPLVLVLGLLLLLLPAPPIKGEAAEGTSGAVPVPKCSERHWLWGLCWFCCCCHAALAAAGADVVAEAPAV
jgi:hypothetical protein